MKRLKKILLGFVFFAILFSITGCEDKKSITVLEFQEKAQEKGYIVQDVKSQFANIDYILNAYIAGKSDYTYQIEFYELDTVENAIEFYQNNKKIFEDSKASTSSSSSVSLKNYSKYSLTTDGKYKVISRIDNTVIYLNVEQQYKNEVKDFLDSIGY